MNPDDLEQYERFLKRARSILRRDGRASEILRVEHRVAESIRLEVPFSTFSGEDSNLPATREAIVPEIVADAELPADGIAALDELLADLAGRVRNHAGRPGWFSRRRLAKVEQNLDLITKVLAGGAGAVEATRKIVEQRTALEVALLNREREIALALMKKETELTNARTDRDRANTFHRLGDRMREKVDEELLLQWERALEELRALHAESRTRVAIAEATMRDLAEKPGDLPTITVDDLRKKGR